MITSSVNPQVKQVVQWQTKGRARRSDGIFLAEGMKMYQEAPEDRIQEVYVSEEALEKIGEYPKVEAKLERTGYEAVSGEVFRKMSDTQTPQGILCVVKRPEYRLEQLLAVPSPLFLVLEEIP